MAEKKLSEGCAARGIAHEDRSILYLVLGLIGLGIVDYAMMQSDLNKLADMYAGAPAPDVRYQAPQYQPPQAPQYQPPQYQPPQDPQYQPPQYQPPQAPQYEAPEAPEVEVPEAPAFEAPEVPEVEIPEAPSFETPADIPPTDPTI